MQEKSDAELLREYAVQANETAFREIVSRHANLVYASALRQVKSPELARDIAQTVFTHLVRKAPSLGQILTENASLVGWLYRSTRFTALTQLRDDRRRLAREREAMENFNPTTEAATEWDQVGPVLDEAMADLNDEDRDALLLRFFKNHDFHAIGRSLGVSDDAAQKRVSRALERLRAGFNLRGVTPTAVALSTAISANAVSMAPAGLVAMLSTAALAGTTLATTATVTATKAIIMTTLQKTIMGAALAAAVGTGIYESRQAATLRNQNQGFQEQQARLADQIQQLTKDRDDAMGQLAMLRDENERLNRNIIELPKLRGDLSQLRLQLASQRPQVSPPARPPGAYIAKDQVAYAGYATPEATLETVAWLHVNGTYDQLIECLSPEMAAVELKDTNRRGQFETVKSTFAPLFKGMQVMAKKVLTDDRVELKYRNDLDAAINQLPEIRTQSVPKFMVQAIVKVGNDWKLDSLPRVNEESWEDEGQIEKFSP